MISKDEEFFQRSIQELWEKWKKVMKYERSFQWCYSVFSFRISGYFSIKKATNWFKHLIVNNWKGIERHLNWFNISHSNDNILPFFLTISNYNEYKHWGIVRISMHEKHRNTQEYWVNIMEFVNLIRIFWGSIMN